MYSEIIKILMIGSSNVEKLHDEIFDELRDLGYIIDERADISNQILEALALYAPLVKISRKLPILKEDNFKISSPAPERLDYCPPKAANLFRKLLLKENFELIALFFELLKNENWIIPVDQLPELLDLGIKQKQLRQLIFSICGERGKWLPKFNPDWHYISDCSEEEFIDFSLANREQRINFLNKLREKHPEEAVDLVKNTWKEEDFQTKLEFLKALSANSGIYDLPFLEMVLKESRKELRMEAVGLLSAIPESSVVGFFTDFLNENFSFTINDQTIILDFKQIADLKKMADFGVLENFKALTEGKQANLKAQLIAAVPPDYWKFSGKISYIELLEAAYLDDFKSSWFWGLSTAAFKFKDTALLKEIHRFFYKNADNKLFGFSYDYSIICNKLDNEFYNKITLAYLKKIQSFENQILRSLLKQKQKWNDELSMLILEKLKLFSSLQPSANDRQMLYVLEVAGHNISDKVLTNCREGWPENLTIQWEIALQHFFEIIELRVLISSLKKV